MVAPLPRHGRPLHCDVIGSGPPVVLLHGVAFGPETFAAVVGERLRPSQFLVPHRPGYGGSADVGPARDVAEQVADIIATIDAVTDGRFAVGGVSGGATLAVALTLVAPARVTRLVVHEPAIGPLAPALAAILSQAAAAFASAADPVVPALALARTLAGERLWHERPDLAASVAVVASTMAMEVPQFAGFAPTVTMLAGLRTIPVVSSVGRESGCERVCVSRVLARTAGATEVELPGAHLAQFDAPDAFAALLTGGQ